MTPIVMAAQLERTEIMRMLIDRCCPDIHPLTRAFLTFILYYYLCALCLWLRECVRACLPEQKWSIHSTFVMQILAVYIGP